MRLKRVKNSEVLADETNSVIIGKKFISVKRAGKRAVALTPHKIVRDGYTEPFSKRK